MSSRARARHSRPILRAVLLPALLLPALALPALALLAGCAPRACDDAAEVSMSRDVDLLVGQQGDLADAAEERLVARGRDAIVHLESGLYSAEPPARRRIIRALAAIGDREALPILDHLARRDPDDYTRAAAAAAAAKLRGGP